MKNPIKKLDSQLAVNRSKKRPKGILPYLSTYLSVSVVLCYKFSSVYYDEHARWFDSRLTQVMDVYMFVMSL